MGNRSTGETSWTPPGPPANAAGKGPDPSALPAGWEQMSDPASGRPYYCNRSTGETSWTPPGLPAIKGADPSAGKGADPSVGKGADPSAATPTPSYGGPPQGYGAAPAGAYDPAMPGKGADPRSSPYGAAPAGYGGPESGKDGSKGGPEPGKGGPSPSPTLPAGWEQITDPSSGRPYFLNRSTGEKSWDPPHPSTTEGPPAAATHPPAREAPPLPAGWEQVKDPSSGRPYFLNRSTGETRWEPPA